MYTCQFEADFAVWLNANPSVRVAFAMLALSLLPYVYRIWRSAPEA